MNKELVARLGKQTGQSMADCKKVLSSMNDEMAARYVCFYEESPQSAFIDPQELDPSLNEVFRKVDAEVDL